MLSVRATRNEHSSAAGLVGAQPCDVHTLVLVSVTARSTKRKAADVLRA
jgi:hypothetical protein